MKVHLVDGTYELFRSYFALPPIQAPDGRPVGAVRGIVQSLLYLLREDQVTHIGVRPLDGDAGETGAKHQLYPLGGSTGQDQKGDQMLDYILLEAEESDATAVEEASWGRIKSHLNSQLD